MSVVSTFMTSEGFSKDDPTALALPLAVKEKKYGK